MRVTEQASGTGSVRERPIRIRVIAQRRHAVLTEEAISARNAARHYDAVPLFQVGNFGSDLDNLAHELVAEDIAFFHASDRAVVEVEVRAADSGESRFYDRVAFGEELR